MDSAKVIKKRDYILKKLEVPLTKSEIESQHKFVNYLRNNGINTAYIYGIKYENGEYIEKQERIVSDKKDISLVKLMRSLASFHMCSKGYNVAFRKKKIYHLDFKCNNVKLKRLLLDYKSKYKKYPVKNLKKCRPYLDSEAKNISDFLLNSLKLMYKHVIKKYGYNRCIIHNDITKNNIISSNNKYYLIDFDMSIKGIELVDIADSFLIKYNDLDNIISNYESFTKDIANCAKEYNKYNSINVSTTDILYQYMIRIISYNLYVVLDRERLDVYKGNIVLLEEILNKMSDYLKKNSN